MLCLQIHHLIEEYKKIKNKIKKYEESKDTINKLKNTINKLKNKNNISQPTYKNINENEYPPQAF